MAEFLAIYTGAALNTPASNVLQIPTVTGTITGVYLDFPAVTDGDAEFGLYEDGVLVTLLTVADTASNENVTGLSYSMTQGKVLSLSLLSPIPTALPAPPWSLIVTYTPTTLPDTASTTEILAGTSAAKYATPDSIAALWEQGSDVASSGTVSLGEGGYFNITGTTTITDIDFGTTKAGRKVWVKFAGILTLTHHATNLILPTGASITTAAGDTACFVSEGGDIVRCVAYNRASGAPLTGSGITALTGDVTASGSGSVAATIANDAVTYAKMQNVSATSRILGRKTSGAGDTEEITIQEALNFIASLAQGDVLYHNGTSFVRLAAGTSGQFLKTLGAGANPLWDTIAGGGDLLSTNNLSDVANAGTALINLGLTATAAELNALDGITSTVTELNYTDGVTSAIQTQLDAKAPKVNPQLALDASQASDDNYAGITIDGRNAASGGLTQWDAVYINGSSEFALADANGSGTYPAVGLVVANASAAANATVLTHGVARNDAWAWTVGGVIYLSATAGGLTQTAPSTSGDKVQVIGIAISADEMLVNPSLDYLTIT